MGNWTSRDVESNPKKRKKEPEGSYWRSDDGDGRPRKMAMITASSRLPVAVGDTTNDKDDDIDVDDAAFVDSVMTAPAARTIDDNPDASKTTTKTVTFGVTESQEETPDDDHHTSEKSLTPAAAASDVAMPTAELDGNEDDDESTPQTAKKGIFERMFYQKKHAVVSNADDLPSPDSETTTTRTSKANPSGDGNGNDEESDDVIPNIDADAAVDADDKAKDMDNADQERKPPVSVTTLGRESTAGAIASTNPTNGRMMPSAIDNDQAAASTASSLDAPNKTDHRVQKKVKKKAKKGKRATDSK